VRSGKATDRTVLIKVRAPLEIANRIAGIQVQELQVGDPLNHYVERLTDDMIVCRCERVSLAEIKAVIQAGVRDMNEIKALTRAGMGACGGKTCSSLISALSKSLEYHRMKSHRTSRDLYSSKSPLGSLVQRINPGETVSL
jgi:NAD(P)H-nitrite reductase large subunit